MHVVAPFLRVHVIVKEDGAAIFIVRDIDMMVLDEHNPIREDIGVD